MSFHHNLPSAHQKYDYQMITGEGLTEKSPRDDRKGMAAQQPFPNNVRIIYSAPPLKLKKNYKHCSKKLFIIFVTLIMISLSGKHLMSNRYFSNTEWCINKPDIPWKGPGNFEFGSRELNNLEMIVSGVAQGNVHISQQSSEESDLSSPSIRITTHILLSHEYLQNQVSITASHSSSNFILRVNTPEINIFPDCVLVHINVTFPSNLKKFGNFAINVIHLNINDYDLGNITFDKIDWSSHPSISARNLKSHDIVIHSFGGILGNYSIDRSLSFQNNNEKIDATVKSFTNTTPESIILIASNSQIRGSFPLANLFEAHTSNGKIDLNVTDQSSEPLQNGARIILNTSNGNIGGTYDVNGEWHASTSNGGIDASLRLADSTVDDLIRISGRTSNGRVNVIASDSYKGRFYLKTSNSKITVEGNDDIHYDVNRTTSKFGYKGKDHKYINNELALFSSNGKINLTFV